MDATMPPEPSFLLTPRTVYAKKKACEGKELRIRLSSKPFLPCPADADICSEQCQVSLSLYMIDPSISFNTLIDPLCRANANAVHGSTDDQAITQHTCTHELMDPDED
jgi:hypothetical protein